MSTSFWKSKTEEISGLFDKAAKAEEPLTEEDKQQQFIEACQLGNIEKVNDYLEKRLQTYDQLPISYALYIASKHGQISIVDRLLHDEREDLCINGILLYTIAENYVEIVDLLLKDPRIDPSAFNNQAIRLAKSRGMIEMVNCLLQDPRTRIFSNKKAKKKRST
jgi:hypothetical protein